MHMLGAMVFFLIISWLAYMAKKNGEFEKYDRYTKAQKARLKERTFYLACFLTPVLTILVLAFLEWASGGAVSGTNFGVFLLFVLVGSWMPAVLIAGVIGQLMEDRLIAREASRKPGEPEPLPDVKWAKRGSAKERWVGGRITRKWLYW